MIIFVTQVQMLMLSAKPSVAQSRLLGQVPREGSGKRPSGLPSSSEGSYGSLTSWNKDAYAEINRIELKKTRLDDGTAPAISGIRSSPATSSLSPRNPATPQGTVPRRPIAYSGSSLVAGVNRGSMSPSDVSLGKGQEVFLFIATAYGLVK
jgi:hypothetical protein